MNKRPTLLILAAGMATRYGSLKQLDIFGPSGETILDYAIYDATKAGFEKVVFVIRKSIEQQFRKMAFDKFADNIDVDFVFQELDILPEGFSVPKKRIKPWGTGHAVWVAASKVKEPFAVINADDFYGLRSFKLMSNYLKDKTNEPEYGLIGYQLKNTLSPHGPVSRGLCEIDHEGYLKSITEQTHIVQTNKGIAATDPHKGKISLKEDAIVSMNLMGFTPSVFPYFETYFKEFLVSQGPGTLKHEFYLPTVVNNLVMAGKATVKVLPVQEKWFGVTFPEDKPLAVQKINDLIAKKIYPENLWTVSKNNI